MKVGLFATGGYTEVGGLQHMLGRWLPEGVTIERCLPVARKGRKLDPRTPAPAPRHSGLTGEGLVGEAERMLARYHAGDRCTFDVLVLVDDADCRFGCAARAGWDTFVSNTRARLRGATGRPDLPVVVLLASPEVESWFIEDFENGFGHGSFLAGCFSNRSAARGAVEHAISDIVGDRPTEDFGCPPANGACTHKLSERLGDAFLELPTSTRGYSKWTDGSLMLKRIDAQVLVDRCPLYASEPLRHLQQLASAAR